MGLCPMNPRFSIEAMEPTSTWHFPGGRSRGFRTLAPLRGFALRFQPYSFQKLAFRASPQYSSVFPNIDSKNARSQDNFKSRQ
ncbi:hypothetical protein E2C01_032027 [Portunus trituberculatus]|uniref:Uncharacterized protein n=1 Tax=Portunus trituberculatus TaxID=210409 RepID=A0A5B7EUC1_PORTR|nr:hypothetical protein [Portunus trituberculatus]